MRKKGVSAKEIDQAREYWYEAYSDRIESGMDKEATVYVLGSVDAAATSGNWVAGAMDGDVSLALGGAAVLLTPIAIQVTSILYQASIRFGRWVAHFLVRVAKGDETGSPSAESLSFWWSRHPDTFQVIMVVGAIICGAGLAMALVSLIACGFAPDTVAPLPTVNTGFLGKINYPHLRQSLSFTR